MGEFVALIVGAHMADEVYDWPELFPAAFEDGGGEHPHMVAGEDWVGVALAAHPSAAAEALCCEALGRDALRVEPDAVLEYFDAAGGLASERWDLYRERCRGVGFDPGEGAVLLVRGVR